MVPKGQSPWCRCDSTGGGSDGRTEDAKCAFTRDKGSLNQHQVREVEVTGLVTRPELNGVRGKVVRHISDKDRWEVVLNNGYGIAALKTVNLHVM